MNNRTWKIAVIGTGQFAQFAWPAMLRTGRVTLAGVYDMQLDQAKSFQRQFGGHLFLSLNELWQSKEVDIVYIATPPWTHADLTSCALKADKHVICEKPAGLAVQEVEDLIKLAESNQLLYVVNLMQRYNPLFDVVSRLINTNLLGSFTHGFFENYASDERLHEEHWFWDQEKSGGIFVEHGVHFFDLFEGWFGKGEVISSMTSGRPMRKKFAVSDRVQSTVKYKNGFVNFYHGFDQPDRMDRQDIRLVFEHGQIELYEWVPVRMKITGLFDRQQLDELCKIDGLKRKDIHEQYEGQAKEYTGRNKHGVCDMKVTLEYEIMDKSNMYQYLISAMICDQIDWLENGLHQRKITEQNALSSLQMAIESQTMAVEV